MNMSDYIIATASTCDIEASWLAEHGVPFISYTFTIGETVYEDDCTPEIRNMCYAAMREGKMLQTSAIQPATYEAFFREILEKGCDLIYTDMSRAISSSIEHAEIAIEKLRGEFPSQRIHFIDSYSITGGLHLFVKKLVALKEEGKRFDEVVEWGEAHKKEYIHRFMVEDLQWLRRGGRLSNASAFIGTLLSIKPMIYVTDEGTLFAWKKVRGRKKTVHELVLSMQEDLSEETPAEITVISADDREDCEAFVRLIKETYPQFRDAEIPIMDLGPTICAHVGPDFLAVCYRGRERVISG